MSEAVARYDRERDRYIKLASRVADMCRVAVEDNAIRAQITSRTKTVRSFAEKLRRFSRRRDKTFATVDGVFARIGDFSGVRVATYRPEDEPRVSELIGRLFCGPEGGEMDVDRKEKLDPAAAQFYRSTHCQVFLRKEELVGDYANLRGASCEIQICSMMAHVWNEIEHDIGYKPEGGGPDDAERGLLEILGHTTRSGDVTITRLLAANTARMTMQTGDFEDVHDFVARLHPRFPDADLSVNAGPAFDAAMQLGLSTVERIDAASHGAALDAGVARRRIEAFNAYLEEHDRPDLALTMGSSDLVLVGLLDLGAVELAGSRSEDAAPARQGRLVAAASAYLGFAGAAG